MNKLKILLGGGLRETINIKSSGGGGVFNYFFAKELAKRGCEVTILGLNGGKVPGCNLIPIASSEEEVMRYEENYLLHDAYQLIESQYIALNHNAYDIIHISYYHYLFAPFSKFISKPIIYTEHLPLLSSEGWQALLKKMVKPSDIFVFVANHAYKKAKLINNKRCILHGIDVSFYPFNPKSDNFLFWLGRSKKKKGLKEAVVVAKKTKKILYAAQAIKRPDDVVFFEQEIKPLVSNEAHIHFVGINPYPEKLKYYQNAKVFLMPIQWEEPFGLVMIESMACGTPVVAFARGSVPEVIKDGETGFIVNPSDDDIRGNWIIKKTGIDGLCEAVERIYSMPEKEYQEMRYNCRKHVEKHFTVERMVDDYIKVYEEVIRKTKK